MSLNLKNKKVLVMGLGIYEEGSGISAVKFLLSQGAKVTVTDLKTKEQLNDQIKRLGQSAKKIVWVLGEHREEDFRHADLIIRNPGVPKSSKYLKIARDHNISIYTDISLFFELVDRKRIIGVTGTRGKSTTATLIYEIIKSAVKSVVIGGNIKKSPLAQLAEIKKGGPVILELSSWMLESLADIKKSPHISVFTNIYPDHLNTYEDLADYISAKENIFRFHNAQDYLVINRDNPKTKISAKSAPSQRFWFSLKYFPEANGCFVKDGQIFFRAQGREQKICSIKKIALRGEHNLANVLGAVVVAMIYGIKPSAIARALSEFKGLPDRLEFLREAGGVKYYNDTTSTTPEATIAALRTLFSSPLRKERLGGVYKNIILIAGGADKGLDFKILAKEIDRNVKALIFLKGTGTERLNHELRIMNYEKDITIADSMADAVGLAKAFAESGDIILLSPACASFGMFVNEFDRGNQFKSLVKKLK